MQKKKGNNTVQRLPKPALKKNTVKEKLSLHGSALK